MCVPGPITSAGSEGVHEMLRTGGILVTNGDQVLELVSPAGEALVETPRGPKRVHDDLPTEQQRILDAVPVSKPASVESIARIADLDPIIAATALERLCSAGLVEESLLGWRLGR
jgi:DNA processing protein